MRCTLCRVMPIARAMPGHGQRPAQDRAEHLPPRRRQPDGTGQLLGHREDLPVEAERGERHPAQQVLVPSVTRWAAISS